MSEREEVSNPDAVGDARSVEEEISERLGAVAGAAEPQTFATLAREIGRLPADRARAVLELSAQLAPLSLRACAEFVRAAPRAARLLDAEDLRAWGELGRRLAMADTETGAQFFAAGAQGLAEVPPGARALLLQTCARQMTLSTSVAVETFRHAGEVAAAVRDAALLASVFRAALEIARRSARHSADFLTAVPTVFAHFEKNFDAADAATVAGESVRVIEVFAGRAGGMASDAWAALPEATGALTAEQSVELLRAAEGFLERGGAAALHVMIAGGEVLRLAPEVFGEWVVLARAVAEQGNAALVAVARSSPNFFRALARRTGRDHAAGLSRRVVAVVTEVARVDAEAAISCLRSAPAALAVATVGQFERWARGGLGEPRTDARARRSYYALETRRSNDALRGGGESEAGLALADVAQTLRFYVEGLTGRAVDVTALAAVPHEARINDGRTIQLPGSVAEFADDALNFRLYKVLAAHAAGQIEFGTHARAGGGGDAEPQINHALRAAFDSLAELYDPQHLDALDAFALDGYINDPKTSERALTPVEEAKRARIEGELRALVGRRHLDGDRARLLALPVDRRGRVGAADDSGRDGRRGGRRGVEPRAGARERDRRGGREAARVARPQAGRARAVQRVGEVGRAGGRRGAVDGRGALVASRDLRARAGAGRDGLRVRRVGSRSPGHAHGVVPRRREERAAGRPQLRRADARALPRRHLLDPPPVPDDEAGKPHADQERARRRRLQPRRRHRLRRRPSRGRSPVRTPLRPPAPARARRGGLVPARPVLFD
ncbi:MAG: hypothetical protein LC774_14315, partial [Acidobacteria bacterium]|nr:hypothetical protein [Acidobacteriota bacterium]